ncbi:sensor histidine kinase [Aneurinibacillus tyrosinisolvens]|uniref:sensor histidine kinase n=1 Tax=Aneurinibacillus tyrosinisolvens TaxID=1443435 RepID=UPI0009E567EB|nr:PAS domain S-box protein [Aneurinibacillus tyrosinisolvens]
MEIHVSNGTLTIFITLVILSLLGAVQTASIFNRKQLKNRELLAQLNKELFQSKQQIQNIFDNLDIAIWWYDGKLKKIPFISQGLGKITGYPSEMFTDQNSWKDIIHPDDVPIFETLSANLRRGIPDISEYRILHANGKIRWVQNRILPTMDKVHNMTRLDGIVVDITSQKIIEKALAEGEERYRRLVELSPVAISLYRNDKFIYVNPAGMNVVGAERPEDIIGTALLDWIHPDDKNLARDLIENTMLNGYSSPVEYKIFRLNGEVVDVSVTSIYDSQSSLVELVFEDITARKQAKRALLESEERYRRLVELSPEAIVLHCDYKFNYVNPAGIALFGASSLGDMIGGSYLDTVHPDYKEETALCLAGVYEMQCTTSIVEQKLVRFDGTNIDVEVISTPIPYMGKNAGLTLLRDVTDRKKAEEERKFMEQIIRETADRYFLLQTSLDRFSHDLFGVMKVSELERRLVKEVQDVLKAVNVSLLEVHRNNDVAIKSGSYDIPEKLLEDVVIRNPRQLPICEIIDTPDGYFLKIGEIRGKSYLLCIGEKLPSLMFTSKRVWLKTITRYVSVLYDNFRLIEDLTKELEQIASGQVAPSWLLRLLFTLSENERKHLSQDLHDAALQEQIIWYRKLDQLSRDRSVPQYLREQLQHITQGLLDVIYQIRITCNELRPPMLKEEGLVSSLEALFEFTQMSTNYCIEFNASDFYHTLHDDLLIGLYRIVQELLANATKHSNASRVHITLSSHPHQLQLIYEDNGVGVDASKMEDSFNSMGVYGMKERVRSMDGEIEFHSSPNKGLAVFISIPILSDRTEIIK